MDYRPSLLPEQVQTPAHRGSRSVLWLVIPLATVASLSHAQSNGNLYRPTSMGETVARLAANDQRQDQRLYTLEQDVDSLQRSSRPSQPSYESGYAAPPASQPVATQPYTVRKGDTLWRIAMTHGVSPGEVMAANGMATDQVIEGSTLFIPQRSAPGKPTTVSTKNPVNVYTGAVSGTHLVGPGDTFSGIARRYQVSQAQLTAANPGINPDVIQLGSSLVIPGAAPKPASVGSNAAAEPAPSIPTKGTYTVRPGDHLGAIAKAHGVATADLAAANQLSDPDLLKVGDVLKLPVGATPTSAAPSTVASTPAPAAAEAPAPSYPTTPKPAKKEAPKPTQVASAASTTPRTDPVQRGVLSYRVHESDTMDSIANDFGTTPQALRELNLLSPSARLEAGDEILVPAMGAVSAR